MTCIEHRKKTKVLDLLSKVCPLLLDGGTAIGKRKRDVRFTIVAERKQGKIKFCWTKEGSEIHHCSVHGLHGRTSRSTRPSLDPCVLADAAVRAPACPKENPMLLHPGSTSAAHRGSELDACSMEAVTTVDTILTASSWLHDMARAQSRDWKEEDDGGARSRRRWLAGGAAGGGTRWGRQLKGHLRVRGGGGLKAEST